MSRLGQVPLATDKVVMLRSLACCNTSRSMRLWFIATLATLLSALSACSPVITVHGQVPNPDDLELIEVGQSSRRDVIQRLGTPSTSSVFSDKVWYYYTETTEQVAFLDPEVKQRKIVAIVFAPDGRVDNIVTYTEADGKDVELVARVTPTAGNELSLLQQLFGNIGRFSKGDQGKEQ